MHPAGSIFLAVAPNGARKTKSDHPRLPLSAAELADCAAACREGGACMIHLHVRDAAGRHSLDIDAYREATRAIRSAVGDSLVIQVTSEAVGTYTPGEQMSMVRGLKPEAVSIAVRELFSGQAPEQEVASFLTWAHAAGIVMQFILYDAADVRSYLGLRRRGVIPSGRHWVLLVLGRYTGGVSRFEDLLPMYLAWTAEPGLSAGIPWSICAFGQREVECAAAAVTLGGHVRIGFENNMSLPDGRVARDNAELISCFAGVARTLGYGLATADDMRRLFA
ncbi:3-keto-5-aminohexanoate cleavage protein [Aestuariivirga sp.]|uniref:3-keto-5-aminohexanoate cleavage protein n=1 Tax=Aestuariivirga sp. TaxID=2650926 RepID=UPI00391ADB41